MIANNTDFNNENEKEQIKNNILCEICQNEKAEYECKECPTFKKLCQKCDLYIHTKENKNNHNRNHITTKIFKTNENNENNDNIKKLNNNLKNETHQVTKNYLNQIKRIYDIDKDIMLNENNLLQQKINTNQNLYIHKINNLKNKLNEIKIKNENNLRLMKENNKMDLKQLIIDKDFEINYLINNNKELEKINNELKDQLNENMDEYTKDQYNYNDILTNLKVSLNNLQKENIDIKEYYENKINFLIDNFNIEKRKLLIHIYELNIEKLNNEYNISKNKYIKYFDNRDKDINNISKKNNDEITKLREKRHNLEEKLNDLKKRKEELMKINNDLRFENNSLNENFERIRKELKFEINRKELEEKKSNETQKDFYKAKKENKKIRKISRAKRSQSVKY